MYRVYCSDDIRPLYEVAKDITMGRDTCLVVPSSEYIHKAVCAFRSAFDFEKAQVVEVHETQDSAIVKAKFDSSASEREYTASVYTMNALPVHENSVGRSSYCGVYFYNMSECLKQYVTDKGYTEVCSIIDVFANDPMK